MNVADDHVISRRSLHNELVDRVRDLISKGELVPGKKIPEKDLCERFGVSRTPLREALKVLASEGIVTLTQNRGAAVSNMTLAEIEEVFPVMSALEGLSGELACAQITEDELKEIQSLHAEMMESWRERKLQAYFRINQAIHLAIVDASRNETLKMLYRGLSARLVTVRYTASMSEQRWSRAVEEHGEMLLALETRNSQKLGRIMRKHVVNKLDTVRDWVKANTAEGG